MGLLSGLTGVGGGIFLSPLLLMLGWAGTKQTSAVAAPFILVNSIAGLAAVFVAGTASLPQSIWLLAAAVLAGAGHLIPFADGSAVVGATYDFDDESAEAREEDHAGNLERLERLLPGATARQDVARLAGSVGFRCVAPDRLPLVGALPEAGAVPSSGAARNLPRAPGLYGAFAYASRGLTWAALGGELIACAAEDEPLPVEGDLADAIDPARFLLRRARRDRP
ncbi:tRNA 5-methylaminomethyl-2-thiouridine biosynthesis bifunctional protein MnmC [compost metagenome]